MAAEKLVLISKHMYIKDQPHAAQTLLDNSINHKRPQLSYLNRLKPLNESTTTTSASDTPVISPTHESPIVARSKNNPQKQALLLTEDDDEGNEMEKNDELSEALFTDSILLQLELTDEHSFK